MKITQIVRRVASVVDEMNYAKSRATALFMGRGEDRR
jgi:hypothetical protein